MNSTLLRLGMMMIGGCAVLGACASSVQELNEAGSTMPVAADRYDTTFDAARQVLRDRGFILERVDAREGVITTQPKTTAGLVTPWDREQQAFDQELEDLFERQQRVVRITFEPTAQAGDVAVGSPGDLPAGERAMRVQVTIQRVHIPGRKIEPEAISQTSYYWDPDLGARGMQPSYAVAYKQDRLLEARLTELIADAAAMPGATPGASAASTEPAAAAPSAEKPAPAAEPAPAAPVEPPPSAPAPPPVPAPVVEPAPAAPEPVAPPAEPAKPRPTPWVPGQPLRKGG